MAPRSKVTLCWKSSPSCWVTRRQHFHAPSSFYALLEHPYPRFFLDFGVGPRFYASAPRSVTSVAGGIRPNVSVRFFLACVSPESLLTLGLYPENY